MPQQVALVPIGYTEWDERYQAVMSAIEARGGHPIIYLALREQADAPRNTCLCYMDTSSPGTVRIVCHPLDREAFESKLQQYNRLADLEFQEIGPIRV